MLRTLDAVDWNGGVLPETGASVSWLGQAGFLLCIDSQRVVIDPYLSDSLAEKYRGKKFPHTRMMQAPVAPDELRDIDWVLCTHGHTDHMDHGTLPALLEANPQARVLVPRSERAKAIERGVPEARIETIDAGETLRFGPLSFTATASAHEELAQDQNGQYLFLGYVISGGNVRVWHSGDTIPYPGLAEYLAPLAVDLALLPINGRDTERAENGVPGNLTIDEALDLTDKIGASAMIGHHFGMFEFNTADPVQAQSAIDRVGLAADVRLAQLGRTYLVAPARQVSMRRILAVCRGNICRSPTVEGVLRQALDGSDFEIDSAAIMDWNVGKSPDPRSAKAAQARGVDISGQVARQIAPEDFDTFDLILGMDAANMEALVQLQPDSARARVLHLGAFLEPGRIEDIPDPYYEDDAAFDAVFDKIKQAVEGLTRQLS